MTVEPDTISRHVDAILAGRHDNYVRVASGETSDIYDLSQVLKGSYILKIFARPDRQAADFKCNQDLVAAALLEVEEDQAEVRLGSTLNIRAPAFNSSAQNKPLQAAHATERPAWTLMPKLAKFDFETAAVPLSKLAKLLDKQHDITFSGLKADLRLDTPFWSWTKWSEEIIAVLRVHPMVGGGEFLADVELLGTLAALAAPSGATLTHGDIHPQNLYDYQSSPCLFDWEELAIAPKERDYGIMLDRKHHAPSEVFDVHALMNTSRHQDSLCRSTLAFYAALARLKRNIVSGQKEDLKSFLKEIGLFDG